MVSIYNSSLKRQVFPAIGRASLHQRGLSGFNGLKVQGNGV